MKHLPIKSFLMLIGFIGLSSYAQETTEIPKSFSFSLEEAIRYGLDHNVEAANAQRDIAISLKQKWEIIAQGLPQISGAVDYQNYIKQRLEGKPVSKRAFSRFLT